MASDATPTVRDCLSRRQLPRLETSLLLAYVLGRSREWLLTHDDESLAETHHAAYLALEARRVQGEPIAYLVGQREFMSLPFVVDETVLIPRPDTELLVEVTLETLKPLVCPKVLDLGTGSGIIAVSLGKTRTDAQIVATDVSEAALGIARLNAQQLGVTVEFLTGTWFGALVQFHQLQTPLFDVIVSNPPYIHPQDAHLGEGDLRFEPRRALTDERDGLGAYDAIIPQAGQWLTPGGWLWLEHGYDQAEAVTWRLRQAGFREIKTFYDVSGQPRVSGASYNVVS